MQKLTGLLYHNRLYFISLTIILLIAILFLALNGKTSAFVSLNSYHPFYLNVFFINYTFLGDGIFALCLIIAMIFYCNKKQTGLALLCSFLISELLVQLIKNVVHAPRPKLYFEPGTYLNFINGVTLGNYTSFPSGHTATAFAMATILVLTMRNKTCQIPVLLAAVLVGYSRIYLAQHFLLDIIVGALLGTLSSMLSFFLLQSNVGLKLLSKKTMRSSLRQQYYPMNYKQRSTL